MAQAAGHTREISEWRDGWRVLLACMLGGMLSALPINTIGAFIQPLEKDFGWSRGAMTAVIPLGCYTMALTAPLIGIVIGRIGARRIGLAGAILLPISLAAQGLVQAPIATYWFAWVGISLAQIFANIMIWTMAVAERFSKNRGAALAVVLMGNSLMGMLYSPIAVELIGAFGWRVAYFFTGFGALVLLVPYIWMNFYDLKDDARKRAAAPERYAEEVDAPVRHYLTQGIPLAMAARSRQYWQLILAVLLCSGSAVALIIHLIPIATHTGLSRLAAATMVSTAGLASTCSKLVIGPLLDRLPPARLAAATMVGPIVACLLLLPVGLDYKVGLLAAALIGVSTGAELDAIGVLTARYFGLAHYGRIYGSMMSAFQVSVGAAPLLLGLAYDRAGNYNSALITTALCLCVGALLLITLGRPCLPDERQPAKA